MTDELETLRAFAEQMAKMPARRAELIHKERATGHTWREIAAALDMTEQGARKAAGHE